ncbi:circadian-associated transcriptional repressor [Labrus bergylta]|uniref:circadian-associated transcriptional repressor n=1 Tax=Labrus bergylta TaxID=56723 RepID=UPI003314352E
MSTSDSDYSIDWLASDEDDCDSSKSSSPQHAEEPPAAPSSSSSRESSSSCCHCGAEQRRKRRRRSDCRDLDSDSESASVSPVQGFTSVCAQAPVGAELRLTRKRTRSSGEDGLCATPQADTENERFFHKCSELQCYIAPLSSILQGLRSGRYSERLSSFQESVAMDRIQRIRGVLQNPHVGRRFFGLLLKIEEMLRSWFPHIKSNVTQTDGGPPAKTLKPPHSSASPRPPSSESPLAASHSSTRLKWLHTSPICSVTTPKSMLARPPPSPRPARCSPEATQDHAVSSTSELDSETPRHLPPAPRVNRGPPPLKIISPCLERLLQAKESVVVPLAAGEEGWMS